MMSVELEGLNKTLTAISGDLVRVSTTLKSIESRITKVEREQHEIERRVDESNHVDWRLWLSVIVAVTGAISWAWTAKLAPVSDAVITFASDAEKERERLRAKIFEESGDRKDDIKRIDESLGVRRDWMEQVSGRLATLEAFQSAISDNRWTSDQQGAYSREIDRRLAILEGWRDRNLVETRLEN